MKHLIKELLRKKITKYCINESFSSLDDWHEYHHQVTNEIFQMINSKQKITFDLMPKNLYNKALKEFMENGRFLRFPSNIILDWKALLLQNIAKLEVLTAIAGHTQHFPFEEFYDVFDYDRKTGNDRNGVFSKWCKKKYKETGDDEYLNNYDFDTASEFLNDFKKIDKYLPLFSNGQWVLSDYGLKPLFNLGNQLVNLSNPNEIIVIINRILDVSHQRSDLAELFIEGGSNTLKYISNN